MRLVFDGIRYVLWTAARGHPQAVRSGTVGLGRRAATTRPAAWSGTSGTRWWTRTGARWAPASLHDSHGGIAPLRALREHWPDLQRCFADGACAGERVADASAVAITMVRAEPGQKGFAVQPRHWATERSFALASIMLLVKRLAQEL